MSSTYLTYLKMTRIHSVFSVFERRNRVAGAERRSSARRRRQIFTKMDYFEPKSTIFAVRYHSSRSLLGWILRFLDRSLLEALPKGFCWSRASPAESLCIWVVYLYVFVTQANTLCILCIWTPQCLYLTSRQPGRGLPAAARRPLAGRLRARRGGM